MVKTRNGAILDITTLVKEHDAVVAVLESQWREWVTERNGGAFKLTRGGGGIAIDKALRRYTIRRMDVILLSTNTRTLAEAKRILAPFWKFQRMQDNGFRFTLVRLTR